MGETQKAPFDPACRRKIGLWRRIFVRRHVPGWNGHPFFLGETPAGAGPLLVGEIPQHTPRLLLGWAMPRTKLGEILTFLKTRDFQDSWGDRRGGAEWRGVARSPVHF